MLDINKLPNLAQIENIMGPRSGWQFFTDLDSGTPLPNNVAGPWRPHQKGAVCYMRHTDASTLVLVATAYRVAHHAVSAKLLLWFSWIAQRAPVQRFAKVGHYGLSTLAAEYLDHTIEVRQQPLIEIDLASPPVQRGRPVPLDEVKPGTRIWLGWDYIKDLPERDLWRNLCIVTGVKAASYYQLLASDGTLRCFSPFTLVNPSAVPTTTLPQGCRKSRDLERTYEVAFDDTEEIADPLISKSEAERSMAGCTHNDASPTAPAPATAACESVSPELPAGSHLEHERCIHCEQVEFSKCCPQVVLGSAPHQIFTGACGDCYVRTLREQDLELRGAAQTAPAPTLYFEPPHRSAVKPPWPAAWASPTWEEP